MKSSKFWLTTFAFFVFLSGWFFPPQITAQTVQNTQQQTLRVEVQSILLEEERTVPGTDAVYTHQRLEIEVLDGEKEGKVLTVENDYSQFEVGDKLYFTETIFADGSSIMSIVGVDRTGPLYFLVVLFVIIIIAFGKWQGVRSLLALGGSFLAIFYVLLPAILNGWHPVVASVLVASCILFAAIFFTHGFNKESLVAYAGTMIAVVITGLFAFFSVHIASLTGLAEDSSTFLYFNTQGSLDFTALLLGAIIIGVLGVLDDISVTQAAVVTEIYSLNETLGRKEVYKKAMRVGREHVGALVNTLILAYAGTSLPLLLHASVVTSDVSIALNSEIFATEIVRAIVGSIGLVLAVPIVTLLAVLFLKGYHSSHGHVHGHSHGHVHE